MWFTPSLALHWHVAEREEIATAQGSCEEQDSPIWPKKNKKAINTLHTKIKTFLFKKYAPNSLILYEESI